MSKKIPTPYTKTVNHFSFCNQICQLNFCLPPLEVTAITQTLLGHVRFMLFNMFPTSCCNLLTCCFLPILYKNRLQQNLSIITFTVCQKQLLICLQIHQTV